MKIAPTVVTLAPIVPLEYRVEERSVRPAVGSKLEDFFKQNPSQLLFAGPISRTAPGAGLTFGRAVPLGLPTKFRPASLAVAPAGISRAAVPSPTIPSSITKTAQAVSFVDAFRAPIEQLAKTHPSLDTPLDVLGVVVATPLAWNAIMRPGPKDNVEISLAVSQAAVSIATVAADFVPGLQHTKQALVWTGVLLKVGTQVRAVICKPEAAAAPPGKRA